MTGNYQPFFFFTSHLSAYLLVNISYLICEWKLFKITSGIPLCKKTFASWKNYKAHCIFCKLTSQIPLFSIKEGLRQLLRPLQIRFTYFSHDQQMRLSKNIVQWSHYYQFSCFIILTYKTFALNICKKFQRHFQSPAGLFKM